MTAMSMEVTKLHAVTRTRQRTREQTSELKFEEIQNKIGMITSFFKGTAYPHTDFQLFHLRRGIFTENHITFFYIAPCKD